METTHPFEFSRPVRLKDLKTRVTHFDIEATEQECGALATRFALPSVSHVSARITVTRMVRDRAVRIEGTIRARLHYLSVVSLEPFETGIGGPFREVLTGELDASRETDIDLPPEEEKMGFIEDGGFDLGEVMAQNLALLLEAHPRAPGEEASPDGIVWSDGDAGEKQANPFAVLAEMQGRLRDGS